MSEHSSIYNVKGELVGRFRNGVGWSSKMERLGEYSNEFVRDNEGNMIAKINGNHVLSMSNEELGYVLGKDIFVGNVKAGSYIGLAESASASIALLFNALGPHGS
ncbi:hypothetical protein [Marinagarivorans cellulosilyticus]|uniref:Uncharacterized protein n=1 Tax=Marinagarivorans cellulosilyticus TaxID=2721545 RepID=A0AAN1WF59_9GAMM|nr:hypothetical protein [Marinagarivorans cellulosilyticus]BCD96477.1 hypothetical protein MARGE09_P0677 [Marinagarivorans cellulosilyticus]